MTSVSPVYLADTLRRIEARQAARAPIMVKPKEPAQKPKIVGYYGTIDSVLGVDRRRRQNDPDAVSVALSEIVRDYLEPADNEVEDATIGNEKLLRGIPAVGRVGGAIWNTRPGDDPKRLED